MNKVVSLITLFFFMIFMLSCSTTYVTKRVSVKPENVFGKDVKIVGVQTKSGAYIEFTKSIPAEFHLDSIQGYSIVSIAKDNIHELIMKDGEISEIVTKDGRRLTFLYISTTFDNKKRPISNYLCTERISIPHPEIDLVWIEKVDEVSKVDQRKVGVAVLGAIAAAIVVIAVISEGSEPEPPPSSSIGGSCPFTYSFDGRKYIFDAEPYGGAICQRLKRTEWCGLESIKEINGHYRIMVRNEMDETQFIDELKLTPVDHPKGVQVIPGPFGQIHTISNPIAPNQAYDSTGRDLMPFISKNDRVFWQTRIEEKDPERKEDLKDELIFEFPKPKETKKAKLVLNGCNTLWGSQSLKKYLDLYGYKVSEWYQQMNHHGPIFFKTNNMQLREELYALQIRVETDEGWKSKGLLVGGGPFISENKAYVLDVSDVSGDMLRIKLTPPATFWMINYLAVDYSEDVPVDVQEISPIQAVDNKGQDVREILEQTDNIYLIMPNIGDAVEMIFESPNRDEGLSRSVLLKASGYYDIHLKGEGEPQYKLLDRLHTEPEFVVQYAFQEFLKWRREILARKNPHEQLKRKK